MSASTSGTSGEQNSGDVSVPTDLTVTSEGDSEDIGGHDKKRVAKQFHSLTLEKERLSQVVEKLRLELQGRDSLMALTKAQYESRMVNLEAQKETELAEAGGKIKNLQTELKSVQEELSLMKRRAAKELTLLLDKCQTFQQNMERLSVKHEEIKQSLSNLQLSEEEYKVLKITPEDSINLKQYAALRTYEHTIPLMEKIKELSAQKSSLDSVAEVKEKELEVRRREAVRLEREISLLRESLIQANAQRDSMRDELKVDDFRVRNFDRLKREKERNEELVSKLEKRNVELEISSASLQKDKEILERKLGECRHSKRNLEQDLASYKQDCEDTKNILERTKDELVKCSSNLKREKERSTELQENLMNSRSRIIEISESLQNNESLIFDLRGKLEVCEKSGAKYRDELEKLMGKYKDIKEEMESCKVRMEKDISSLKFELNDMRSSYNSLSKNHQKVLEENTNLVQASQSVKTSLHEEKLSVTSELAKLRGENETLKYKISQYTSLEEEYKASVMSAAALQANLKNDENIDPNINKTGRDYAGAEHASGAPGEIDKRGALSWMRGIMSEETISLTRRILVLERKNADATVTVTNLTNALELLKGSINSYKTAISMAGKPSSDLMSKIKMQQDQIVSLELALKANKEAKEERQRELESLRLDLKKAFDKIEQVKIQSHDLFLMQEELKRLKEHVAKSVSVENKESNVNLPGAIKITKGGKSR